MQYAFFQDLIANQKDPDNTPELGKFYSFLFLFVIASTLHLQLNEFY
jgi:hypothetical protein